MFLFFFFVYQCVKCKPVKIVRILMGLKGGILLSQLKITRNVIHFVNNHRTLHLEFKNTRDIY